MEPNQDQTAPESAPVINEPPKAEETPVLGGTPASHTPATAPAAPKKSSSAGLIVAIILAVLILAGGAVAAILIITNSNNGNKGGDNGGNSQQGGDDNGGGNGKKTVSNPEKSNDNYYINVDGVKVGIEDKISKFEKTDFDITKEAKGKTVPANKYYVLLGSEFKSDNSTVTFDYTPYNDTSSDMTVSEAKLGGIEIEKTSKGKASDYEKITFYGGIHIGSSRDDLIEAFGEPAEDKVEKDEDDGSETIEYVGGSYMRFEFKIENDTITKIKWINYTNLLKK